MIVDQLDLFEPTELCRRDHAGCGVHHAVWEARFSACWFVRQVGRFEDAGDRARWAKEWAGHPPCRGWLSKAQVAEITKLGASLLTVPTVHPENEGSRQEDRWHP